MSLTTYEYSLWSGIIKLFPPRESSVIDVPARDGNVDNLFYYGVLQESGVRGAAGIVGGKRRREARGGHCAATSYLPKNRFRGINSASICSLSPYFYTFLKYYLLPSTP